LLFLLEKQKMLHQAKSYIKYKRNAVGKHGVHSPFVFDLMRQVFDKNDCFYAFKPIELIRENLKLDKTKIEVLDLGAGSKKNNDNKRSIRQIITQSAKAPKYGQLLFRLVNYLNCNIIVEIGTSLGMTTLYLANAKRYGKIYTLEGSPEIALKAKQNFKKLNLKNITLIEGDFNNTLPTLLQKLKQIDFVFFDGNHTQEATLNYFAKCLEKKHNNTVFVFDDIYWSEGMTAAWEKIKKHKEVTTTIDIFEMGIVFFRKELPKQDLVIKY